MTVNAPAAPRLDEIPPEFPHLRAALERYYAEHPEEALCADGATRALEAVLRAAAGAVHSQPVARCPHYYGAFDRPGFRLFCARPEGHDGEHMYSTHDLYDALNPDAAAVAAPAQQCEPNDIVQRLRNASNWLRQGYGSWKTVTNEYDRAPFDAADEIERLRAQLAALHSDDAAAHESESCAPAVNLTAECPTCHAPDNGTCAYPGEAKLGCFQPSALPAGHAEPGAVPNARDKYFAAVAKGDKTGIEAFWAEMQAMYDASLRERQAGAQRG